MKRNAITVACVAVLAIALLLPAALMGKLQPESAVHDAVKLEVVDPSASQQALIPEQQEQSLEGAENPSDGPLDEPEYVPGVVLVGIADSASIDQVNERLRQLDYVATDAVSESDLLYGYAELTLSEGVDVEEAIARLEQEDFVAASQPNYVYHALDIDDVPESASSVAADNDGLLVAQSIDMSAQTTSINDPDRSQQWGLQAIKAYNAWDNAKSNHKVTVAVLDSGLDMNHPDFVDASNKTNVVSPYSVLQANKGGNTSNVADALGHGTHVAGIISAGTNNGVGVAGVSYNANIMPVQVIEYPVVIDGKRTNRVTSADAAKGVNYIVNHKNADPSAPVRVINVSFGTTDSYTPGEGDDKLFTSALQSARQADILVVYAAGNGGSNGAYTCFPCDADPDGIGVISVKQSGSTYTRASSSNYNQSGKMTKELSAPGQTIYSTWINSSYKSDSGTSMAAPFVSGTAALMFAVAKDKNISLTAQEVKDILCSTAQDLNTTGFDLQTGYGLIDAQAAVSEVVNGSIKGASTVAVGGSVQLTLSRGTASNWSSSDTSVATVNSSGLVLGRKVGATTITAIRNGKKMYHTLTVQANSIKSCTVSLPSTPTYYTYNGKAQEPTVTVKYGSTTLKKGTDYTVTYSNNVRVGTATVKVTGIGSFKDSVSKTFAIKGTIDQVALSPTVCTYTGYAVRPTLTVKGSDGSTLSSSAYTATFYNNVNAGTNTAYVIVRGVSNGQYTGSKTVRFSIVKAPTCSGASRVPVGAKATYAVTNGSITIKSGAVYATLSGNTLTAKATGTVVLSIRDATGRERAIRTVQIYSLSGVYSVRSSLDSSKGLDIAGGSLRNGGNAQLYSANGTGAQAFVFALQSDGYFKVASARTGKVLDVSGGSTSNGANVQQWVWNGTAAQRWRIDVDASNRLIFVNKGSGKVLDVSGGSKANGANVQQYTSNGTSAQRWTLASTSYSGGALYDGVYRLTTAVNSSYALDVAGGRSSSGANVQVWSSNGTGAQQWAIEYAGSGYYKLTCTGSGKVLDVSGGSSANGANVQQWSWNGSAAQLWGLTRNSDGTYTFVNKGSGRALDVSGGVAGNGRNIHQWVLNGTKAQRWWLYHY